MSVTIFRLWKESQRKSDEQNRLFVRTITDKEIEELTEFQEKWFKHEIVRQDWS